jgi:hypothetical protein
MGRKHILDLLIDSTHTNVILLSVPHRHDLIKDSCVDREEVFNGSLGNSLKCFGKVKLIDVVNEREFFTKHGQHLNQASATYVTLAKRGTRNDFQWHAESIEIQ